MKSLINDLTYFPQWGSGIWKVWRRNFLYFRYTIFAAMGWIFIEPILLLTAFGYGLGQFVTEINGQSYAAFIAPALMANTALFVSFFEGTYGTFTKLSKQNTLHTIIISPVSPDEVALAEIAWATSKAFLSVIAVSIVTVALGLIDATELGMPLLFLLVFSWGVSAFGVLLATVSKTYDWFIYFQSGIITPMALFCGTYFPIDQLPTVIGWLAYGLPLTHVLQAVRSLLRFGVHADLILNLSYLLIFAIVFTNLAAAKMKKKLII